MSMDEKFDILLRTLREGHRLEVALVTAGMTVIEYQRLRKSHRENERSIRLAMMEKERAVVESLTRAALDGNTDAARWYLERVSEDYMSVEKRRAAKLAEDKWRMEKKIIEAELAADPTRIALQAGKKKPKSLPAEVVEVEAIDTGG